MLNNRQILGLLLIGLAASLAGADPVAPLLAQQRQPAAATARPTSQRLDAPRSPGSQLGGRARSEPTATPRPPDNQAAHPTPTAKGSTPGPLPTAPPTLTPAPTPILAATASATPPAQVSGSDTSRDDASTPAAPAGSATGLKLAIRTPKIEFGTVMPGQTSLLKEAIVGELTSRTAYDVLIEAPEFLTGPSGKPLPISALAWGDGGHMTPLKPGMNLIASGQPGDSARAIALKHAMSFSPPQDTAPGDYTFQLTYTVLPRAPGGGQPTVPPTPSPGPTSTPKPAKVRGR
ncbi:MAG: hypothetical protein IT307_14575 [Chloroflexi bacterium]|nr:hypothetical protein [Chloroflexota bacterium]